MLNFFYCFLVLALCGFVFRALWRRIITPVNRRFVLEKTPTRLPQILWLLIQIYIVFGWAAICINIAHLFANKHSVLFWWSYYVLAFFGCGAPLYVYEKKLDSTNTIFFFSAISFIVFSIFPILTLPWRWFLKFVF
jgi:hypothetical protein